MHMIFQPSSFSTSILLAVCSLHFQACIWTFFTVSTGKWKDSTQINRRHSCWSIMLHNSSTIQHHKWMAMNLSQHVLTATVTQFTEFLKSFLFWLKPSAFRSQGFIFLILQFILYSIYLIFCDSQCFLFPLLFFNLFNVRFQFPNSIPILFNNLC